MENTQRVIGSIYAHISNVANVAPKVFGTDRLEYIAPNNGIVIIDVTEDVTEYVQIRVRLVTEFASVTQSVSHSVAYSVGRALIAIVNG